MSFKKPFYLKRDIISHSEGKLPVIRFLGFCTMTVATIAMSIAVAKDSPAGISVSFFIIMLGFSFSFPELLEGNDGLSTMRIIVFMVTNVICMLLLKIGWDKPSLKEIGLDEWWMGVIAFVFGAKAAQTYFESKLAVPKTSAPGDPPKELTDLDYVNLAIGQNQSMLYARGNIRLLAPGKKKVNNTLIDCVTIHLKDSNVSGIPTQLIAIPPKGPQRIIETEIITQVDKPRVSLNAGDSIGLDSGFLGSIGGIVKMSNGDEHLLTCSHVMTKGSAVNHNGNLSAPIKSALAGKADGDWFYALRDSEFDIALIKNFTGNPLVMPGGLKIKGSREMIPDDTKKTAVKMIGRTDFYNTNPAKNAISGFVVNYQALNAISLGYTDGDFELINLMLISESIDPDHYKAISKPGDSGSIVMDEKGLAIGLVVAQNSKFTYAIPISRILKKLVATI